MARALLLVGAAGSTVAVVTLATVGAAVLSAAGAKAPRDFPHWLTRL